MSARIYPPVRRATRRRYVLPNHWIHVSARTQQGRFAFENFAPEFKALAWGIIGAANVRYGVKLAAFVLMGNHFHALIQARKSARVSSWCQYVKAGLARLTHEAHGTQGTVWDGPFRHTNLLTDFAELAWFRYVCAHGLKEGLVNHPGAWPGPNCIDALLNGTPIEGLRLDRDGLRRARRTNPQVSRSAFLQRIPVELTPLSVGHRSPTVWRETCRQVIGSLLVEHTRPLPEAYTSTIRFSHIPETTKKSRAQCFDARAEDGWVDLQLLAEAEETRQRAVSASVVGYQRMTQGAWVPAPLGLQHPALLIDAVDEEHAEAAFPWRAALLPNQAAG